MTGVSKSDYSKFKISEEDLSNGENCNINVFEPQMAAVISKLDFEYEFESGKKESPSNIVILNKNTNEVSISVDYTIDSLIQQNSGEAAQKLKELRDELGKDNKNWEIIKKSLIWILNFSKDLFIQILPILLEKKL